MQKTKKGELTFDTLIPWVIAIGLLVLIILSYIILSGKGTSALTYLKDLFRFGR